MGRHGTISIYASKDTGGTIAYTEYDQCVYEPIACTVVFDTANARGSVADALTTLLRTGHVGIDVSTRKRPWFIGKKTEHISIRLHGNNCARFTVVYRGRSLSFPMTIQTYCLADS